MTMTKRCLIMLARYPEPGVVKTRLAADLGDEFTAALYGSFVADLLARLASEDYHLRVAVSPAARTRDMARRFGGPAGYHGQAEGDLGARMKSEFLRAFADDFATAVLIGSDCPDLDRTIVQDTFRALEQGCHAAIGPARDGGYYLIGFRRETILPRFFAGMAWGADSIFAETLQLLRERSYWTHLAPAWRDVDTSDDLRALVERSRGKPFARSRTMILLDRYRW
jgi:uncharacterized protein